MNRSTCPLCQAAGVSGTPVEDYFFGHQGRWDYLTCSNRQCGAVWPLQWPDPDELAAAYQRYYTHEMTGGEAHRRVLAGVARLAYALGYPHGPTGRLTPLARAPGLGRLLEDAIVATAALQPTRGGRLADIGCGNGEALSLFEQVGWGEVEGVEPDPVAVENARADGRPVRLGSAEQLPWGDETLDAVVMHHVIEHLGNTLLSLGEARRVLRPGGRLAIVTPNAEAAMRAKWERHWRGYEAPRHLVIFTQRSLRRALEQAGFTVDFIHASHRSTAWMDEVSAVAAGAGSPVISTWRRQLRADRAFRAQPAAGDPMRTGGEELVAVARKAAGT